MNIKLFATPLSHFSRKIRVLMDLYSILYEFVDVGNVAEAEKRIFGQNPLMKVPVIVDGDNWILESDHIASYLVKKYDKVDRFQVQIENIFDLNARSIMNGIMTEEVKIILSDRTGIPIENYKFFDKAIESIKNSLSWLEENADNFDGKSPKYREIHLVCLWDHLDYYGIIPMKYRKLKEIVTQVSEVPLINQSNPYLIKPK